MRFVLTGIANLPPLIMKTTMPASLPMNLKFFVGWANSFIRVPDQKFYGVCPRGTRYEKLRGHTQRVQEPLRGTQRVQEPLRGKSVPTLRAPVHGTQFGRKIGDCGLSRRKAPLSNFPPQAGERANEEGNLQFLRARGAKTVRLQDL